MSGQQLRTAVCERLESSGYRWLTRVRNDDLFLDERTGHQVTLVPWPRWGRRVDLLTLMSSFPLPTDERARAFHLDLGSQVNADGLTQAGRWNAAEVVRLVDEHVVPYLERARSAGDVLDMLVAGQVRPMGSASARAVVQHGYYLAKWWQLRDRIGALRFVASLVGDDERAELERAPWGTTELAEVLWYGRELPAAPDRVPWGLADQGDPRAERWYQGAVGAARTRGAEPVVEPEGVRQTALQTPGSI